MTDRTRILIVENDWLVASAIRAMLRSVGENQLVAIALQESKVERLVSDHAPTLALVGVRHRQPDDGVETARALLARGVRVIFTITHAEDDLLARLRGVAGNGILTKPFTSGDLRGAIEAALRVNPGTPQ